ncbi:MAG: hypothetical protein Ct9H300mP21_10070 [Pseudomonadota bacterium]|nr:MAG: hypothetical protein Ct9H300mP21_10070 [Pseudomonadota bacterium]
MTMKGGQAKTTLAINLASRIAKARREVLLIDSDIQANVTTTFKRDHHCNLANVIWEESVTLSLSSWNGNPSFFPLWGGGNGGGLKLFKSNPFQRCTFKKPAVIN